MAACRPPIPPLGCLFSFFLSRGPQRTEGDKGGQTGEADEKGEDQGGGGQRDTQRRGRPPMSQRERLRWKIAKWRRITHAVRKWSGTLKTAYTRKWGGEGFWPHAEPQHTVRITVRHPQRREVRESRTSKGKAGYTAPACGGRLSPGCQAVRCCQVICRAVGQQSGTVKCLCQTSCQVLSVLSGAVGCVSDRRGAL